MDPEEQLRQQQMAANANMSSPDTGEGVPVDPSGALMDPSLGAEFMQPQSSQMSVPEVPTQESAVLRLANALGTPLVRRPGMSRQTTMATTQQIQNPIDPAIGQAVGQQSEVANQANAAAAMQQANDAAMAGQGMQAGADSRFAASAGQEAQNLEFQQHLANQSARVDGLLQQAQQPAVRGQFLQQGGVGARVGMGLGLLFAALQGGAAGDPQMTSRFLDNLVNQNLEDQIRERNNTYQNAQGQANLFSMFERELGSRQAATEATRAALLDYTNERLQALQLNNLPEQVRLQLQAQQENIQLQALAARQAAAQAAAGTTEIRTRTAPTGGGLTEVGRMLFGGARQDVQNQVGLTTSAMRRPGGSGPTSAHGYDFASGLGNVPVAEQNAVLHTLRAVNNVEANINRLLELSTSGSTAFGSERNVRAAAAMGMLQPLIREIHNTGVALSPGEEANLQRSIVNPTDFFSVNGRARLQETLARVRAQADTEAGGLGGRRAAPAYQGMPSSVTP